MVITQGGISMSEKSKKKAGLHCFKLKHYISKIFLAPNLFMLYN